MKKKIAVPVNDTGILDTHFGHCKFFALFEVDNNTIISEEKVVPPSHEPGVLPRWLAELGATDIIAGGMGQKAIQIFNNHRVNVFVGVTQSQAKELVKGFVDDSLSFSSNYCDH